MVTVILVSLQLHKNFYEIQINLIKINICYWNNEHLEWNFNKYQVFCWNKSTILKNNRPWTRTSDGGLLPFVERHTFTIWTGCKDTIVPSRFLILGVIFNVNNYQKIMIPVIIFMCLSTNNPNYFTHLIIWE